MDVCGSRLLLSPPPNDFEQYYSEIERLRSFENWGILWFLVSPLDLARWGFFSLPGRKGSTQCAFCAGVVNSWNGKASPKDTHLQLFPNCPLLNNRDTVEKKNIPFSYPIVYAPLRDHSCGCFCCYSFGRK
jgi:hypothetical protein